MLATLGGFLALLLGLTILLLPLLVTELSRPRDSVWGAVVLLLALVLVTTSERLTGAPMLAVLCGGLLVGRLTGEVAQGRWRALTDEERLALRSAERWKRSLDQLGAIAASLLQSVAGLLSAVSSWQAERRQGRSHGKRWVRSEPAGASGEVPGGDSAAASSPAPGGEPALQTDGEMLPPEGVPGGAPSPEAAAVAASDGKAEPAAPPSPPVVTPSASDAGQAPQQQEGAPGPSPEVEGSAVVSPNAQSDGPPGSEALPAGASPDHPAAGETGVASGESIAAPSQVVAPASVLVATSSGPGAEGPLAPGAEPGEPGVRVVSDFHEIGALLDAALPETVPGAASGPFSQIPHPETPPASAPEG